MKTESIYTNFGKAVKDRRLASFTRLSKDAIEMVSNWKVTQITEMYAAFSVRFLKREVMAWDKLGKYHISNVVKEIIQTKTEHGETS